MVLLSGIHVWGSGLVLSWLLPISSVLVLVGLGSVIYLWTRPLVGRVTQLVLVGSAIIAFIAIILNIVIGNPVYGTDELAFDQYAAQLAFNGLNPYLHSMAPSLPLFHVPDIFHTYLLNGQVVNSLSYPAGSFLVYLPALALGLHTQLAPAIDAFAWVTGIVLAWFLLPEDLKWVPPIILLASVYIDFTAGGVTDTIYLPFLVLGLWKWDRFANLTEHSLARWIGPIAIGLAATVKQTPWFLIPFLLLAIWLEVRQRGGHPWPVVARYAGLLIGTFVLVNIDYLVHNPLAWLRAILVPIQSSTEPGGQGLVSYTMFKHLGGDLRFFSLAGFGALVMSFGVFALWYPQMKRVFPFLIALVFFFPSRSFGSYLIMLLPAGLVGAITVRPAEIPPRLVRRSGIAMTLVGALILVVSATAALTISPALELQVLGETSTGQAQTIDFLRLAVTNHSSARAWPHYAVDATGQISSFWNVVIGPSSIPADSTAYVTIEAPNTQSMPSVATGFIVDVFTAHPAQMASTPEINVNLRSTFLTPQDVNTSIPLGSTLTFRSQVVDRFNNPIEQAGIRINLGQIIYEQYGLQFGEASINGQRAGASPVSTYTNSKGVATFTVLETQLQAAPLFLQTWIDRTGQPSVGYSNIVSIQFVAAKGLRP